MIRAIHVKPTMNIPCSECCQPACRVLSEDTDGVLGEIVQAECFEHMTPGCENCGEYGELREVEDRDDSVGYFAKLVLCQSCIDNAGKLPVYHSVITSEETECPF